MPRATRVCERCLAAATPWVRHDYECRVFRCRRRLVPSEVVEYKRRRQFGCSPLNVLPEDGLVAIAGYLSGAELRSLFQVGAEISFSFACTFCSLCFRVSCILQTCSALCRVAERVARDRSVAAGGLLPTGPIVETKRKDGFGQSRDWLYFEGTAEHDIRAPDDQNVWVRMLRTLLRRSRRFLGNSNFDFS